MAQNRKPDAGSDGLSKSAVLLGSSTDEDSPTSTAYQYLARQRLAEAREMSGAAQFAAMALATHFATRALSLGVHHG